MKILLRVFSILCVSLFVTGCSVKYGEEVRAEKSNPEFVFSNLIYSKYENNKLKTKLQAQQMEKYKSNSEIYATNITFESFDENAQPDTSGSCGYLFANPDSELYELYDNINISSKEYKANFSANSLKYNGKTEQLVGSKTDTVKIEKDDTVIYGTGFSASGLSDTFAFSGTVTGDIQTDKEENANAQ
ncbi:MAG: LPS export ABC transporter periplasmic protein LptC [Treponema sp.]|nr:LPS export ABC transporter periplasmic protein LptC [Treponema sp.]